MLKKRQKVFLAVVGTSVLSAVFLLCFGFVRSPKVEAAAGINQQINFQARLLNSQGATVADGTYNMRFKIYQDGDGVLGGGDETLKWTETRQNSASAGVTVKNGYFSVNLGSVTAFASNIDWNQDTLWLSIDIGGTSNSGSPTYDGEMTPFKRLAANPYALNAGQLSGLTSSNFVQLAQGVQSDSSTTNASISINKTGSTANILTLQKSGSAVFTVGNTGATAISNTSTTALLVQNASSVALLTADTSGSVVTIGNTTNGIALATGAAPVYYGTARPTVTINLIPEYPGAVLTAGSGSGTNSGTMTSDFCSESGRLNVKTTFCANSGEEHNYYSWLSTSGSNDYDIYVRYKMPSNFDGFSASTAVSMYGWRTDSSSSGNKVELALFNASNNQCGSTTNVATGTATWTSTTMTGDVTALSNCTAITADSMVTWRIRMTSAGATKYVLAGEIQYTYKAKF